jgi:hypothetical protein
MYTFSEEMRRGKKTNGKPTHKPRGPSVRSDGVQLTSYAAPHESPSNHAPLRIRSREEKKIIPHPIRPPPVGSAWLSPLAPGNAAADPLSIPLSFPPPDPTKSAPALPPIRSPSSIGPSRLAAGQAVFGLIRLDWIPVRSCGSPIELPLGFRRARSPSGRAEGFYHGGEELPQAAPEGVPRALQGELPF